MRLLRIVFMFVPGALASQDPNPPRMHVRQVQHQGAVNRIRAMPQQPGIVAAWGETGVVSIFDLTQHLSELAAETGEPKRQKQPQKLSARQQFAGHGAEGFAIDWSPVAAGRLATGDCRSRLHIWEPTPGGKWAVGSAQCTGGHTASVEDIQWSPSEETVLASCSVDKTIRVWDTRSRTQPMISVTAHETDVNVVSWNRCGVHATRSTIAPQTTTPTQPTSNVFPYPWHESVYFPTQTQDGVVYAGLGRGRRLPSHLGPPQLQGRGLRRELCLPQAVHHLARMVSLRELDAGVLGG